MPAQCPPPRPSLVFGKNYGRRKAHLNSEAHNTTFPAFKSKILVFRVHFKVFDMGHQNHNRLCCLS